MWPTQRGRHHNQNIEEPDETTWEATEFPTSANDFKNPGGAWYHHPSKKKQTLVVIINCFLPRHTWPSSRKDPECVGRKMLKESSPTVPTIYSIRKNESSTRNWNQVIPDEVYQLHFTVVEIPNFIPEATASRHTNAIEVSHFRILLQAPCDLRRTRDTPHITPTGLIIL